MPPSAFSARAGKPAKAARLRNRRFWDRIRYCAADRLVLPDHDADDFTEVARRSPGPALFSAFNIAVDRCPGGPITGTRASTLVFGSRSERIGQKRDHNGLADLWRRIRFPQSRHPQVFDRFRFSALAPQSPFLSHSPIYPGMGNSSSQGRRMPTFRLEKFTVTQERRLRAKSHILPTENEPIFRYRRPGLEPERLVHLAIIQSKANSWYAIQKTGVMDRVALATRAPPTAITFLRSPNPLKKNEETDLFPIPRLPSQIAMRL
jgi:hypothetical protein